MDLMALLEMQKKQRIKKRNTIIIVLVAFVALIILAEGAFGRLNGNTTSKSTQSKGSAASKLVVDELTTKANYIEKCETIDYKTLARNPDNYKGKTYKFSGKVFNVNEPGLFSGESIILVNVTCTNEDFSLWEDTISMTIVIPKGANRIIEDDIIEFYGECKGLKTYTTVLGANISVPEIEVKYYFQVDHLESSSSPPDNSNNETVSQKNAVKKAKSYLDFSAFSHDGLIKQLEFEGFLSADAIYGADNCGADWNEQAVKKAKSYLDFTAFSKQSLIEQLIFEGFTNEQAEYGARQVGFE